MKSIEGAKNEELFLKEISGSRKEKKNNMLQSLTLQTRGELSTVDYHRKSHPERKSNQNREKSMDREKFEEEKSKTTDRRTSKTSNAKNPKYTINL